LKEIAALTRVAAPGGAVVRIALIAMSGVRAHNPVLTEIGLTLPGFAERGKTIASLPSLSLLTLAALTPDRHQLEYVEVSDIGEMGELPECDMAALSTYTAQAKDAYELSDALRRRGTKTVIGGLHATSLPEEALAYCDAVVVGEGEPAWPEVLAAMEAGNLAGIYGRNSPDFDLAESPTPRFDLLEPERYNRLTVQTQRGCPWRCEFCASSILLTDRYKQKPVPRVVSEIEAIKEIWNEPFIELADDNTFVNKHYGRQLATALAEMDVRWFTETDISVADDPILLGLLKEAGCRELLIGLESPTEPALAGLELKSDWKRKQFDRYHRAIEVIQSHGIAVNACFVLGLDGHGPEVFDEVESFVEKTLPFDVQITALTPFPGTPLYDRLLAEGRIVEPEAWEMCTLFDVNFLPAQMSVEELETWGLALGMRLYSSDATARRRQGFKDQMAAGPID
jgi:radical SAM superfamily enzyme YgiQ (UPF0313 family)